MKKRGISNKERSTRDGGFFSQASVGVLIGLPERSQEILKKRFGLADGKIETLEKIGSDYQITRERVRQIISDSIKKIAKNFQANEFAAVEEKIVLEISNASGIISEDEILRRLSSGSVLEERAVAFLAICSDKMIESKNSEKFLKKSWALSKKTAQDLKEFYEKIRVVFETQKTPMTDAEVAQKIGGLCKEMTKKQIIDYLGVLSEITKNKFGKWGMVNWMEINPKGTRERVYLILKEKNSPLHFTKIAKLIDESGISKKKAHPQTVHNELIKDKRFVLIGRGIYALKEWGYNPGTIKEVIADILGKSDRPMSKESILDEIAKFRQVKKTTVMINLNNKSEFTKNNGLYQLKNK